MLNSIRNGWFSEGKPTAALLIDVVLLVWIANSFFLQARTIIYHNDPADIAAYYTAAEVKRTAAGSIYDTDLLNKVGVKRNVGTEVRPYVYPPLLAEILAPTTVLSYRAFRLSFLIGMHLLIALFFLVTVGLVKRQCPRLNKDTVALVVLLVLVVSSAVERDLFTGQINIGLGLVISAAFLVDSRKHYLVSGLLVAIAVVIKLFPAVFILYFFLRHRYKAAVAGTVFVILLGAVSIAAFGASSWVEYGSDILPSFAAQIYPSDVSEHTDLTTSNYSVLNFLYLLALGFGFTVSAETLTFIHKVLALLVFIVFGSVFWAGRRLRENPVIEMQLLFCLVMLVAPIVWSHWFVYMIPGFVYASCRLILGELESRESLFLILAFFLIALADYGPNLPFIRHGPLLLVKLLKLYGLLAFTGLFARLFLRGSETTVEEEVGSEAT